MHSDDAGSMHEDGFSFIIDLVKDMIVSDGENVCSAEVENALASHSDITTTAVIGVPDMRWGEAGAAFVVLRQGAVEQFEAFFDHCCRRIAGYKYPRSIGFRSELPRTDAGKTMKSLLCETDWNQHQRRVN